MLVITYYDTAEGIPRMTKRISVREARVKFSDLIDAVVDSNEPVIIEHKGQPAAVLISPDQFERYREQIMGRFATALDELDRRNAGKQPDDVLRDVTALVEEVRQERHERAQQR